MATALCIYELLDRQINESREELGGIDAVLFQSPTHSSQITRTDHKSPYSARTAQKRLVVRLLKLNSQSRNPKSWARL